MVTGRLTNQLCSFLIHSGCLARLPLLPHQQGAGLQPQEQHRRQQQREPPQHARSQQGAHALGGNAPQQP